MFQKTYVFLDRIWQEISKVLFVRFNFEIDLSQLKTHKPHQLIFCLNNGGILEFLILSSWSRKQGYGAITVSNKKRILLLSKPSFFFKILFGRTDYGSLFLSSSSGPRLLFLSNKERKKLFEPTKVERLLKTFYLQKKTPELEFLPTVIQWRKTIRSNIRNPSEYLLGLSSRPNLIGKFWYLIRKRRDSIVKSLEAFPLLASDETRDSLGETTPLKLARQTRRKILVTINQELRVSLGPSYISPYEVKESILRDPDLQKLIDEIALSENRDRRRVLSEAYDNLNEIVSNYRFRTIEVCYVLFTWLFSKVFDGLSVKDEDLQMVRETMKYRPIVFVSSHRSHFDYLVIPYVLFLHNMVTPYTAAGINLSFWPVGAFLRTGGAFFIRRSFRGNNLYALCLKKYVEYLLKNKFNIKFFIEGTRSRTGKMLAPAYGMLKMIFETCAHRTLDDIALIPVSICYDEVPEQKTYTDELSGHQKKKESTKELIRSRDVIQRRYGKVYVRFGNPLSVKQILKNEEEQSIQSTLNLQKTAFEICKTINDVTPLTPKSILSMILLSSNLKSLSLETIHRLCTFCFEYAQFKNYPLISQDSDKFRRLIEKALKVLTKNKIVNEEPKIPREYHCFLEKRIVLSIYRNISIHAFVNPAVMFVSILASLARENRQTPLKDFKMQAISQMLLMRDIFKFEFFFSPTHLFIEEVKQDFTFLLGDPTIQGWTVETYIKSNILKWKRLESLVVFQRLLSDLIEGYHFALNFIKENNFSKMESKGLIQKMIKQAEKEILEGKLCLPETISKQSFLNAVQLFKHKKWIVEFSETENKQLEIQPWGSEQEALLVMLKDLRQVCFLELKGFLQPYLET